MALKRKSMWSLWFLDPARAGLRVLFIVSNHTRDLWRHVHL